MIFIIVKIIICSIRKKKAGMYDWPAPLFLVIIPIIITVYIIRGTLIENDRYNRYARGESLSAKGSFYLDSVDYGRGGPYYTFKVDNILFEGIRWDAGDAVSQIENGSLVEIHYLFGDGEEPIVIIDIFVFFDQ